MAIPASVVIERGVWESEPLPRHALKLRPVPQETTPLIQTIIVPVPGETRDRITSVVRHFFAEDDMRSYEGDLGWLPSIRQANVFDEGVSFDLHRWIAECCRYVTLTVNDRVRHHELYDIFAGLFPSLLYTYAPGLDLDDATFIHGVPGVHPDYWTYIETILDDVHRISDF